MTQPFAIVFRGYERPQVDQLLAQADRALADGGQIAGTAARIALSRPELRVVLRGYDRPAVEQALDERLTRLGGRVDEPPRPAQPYDFTIVLRGYLATEVEQLLTLVDQAIAAGETAQAREALTGAEFAVALRGYDRDQVDAEIKRRLDRL